MIIYESELKHYGVKGMKWGQRRARSQSAKYAKKIKRGSPHAITGLAFETTGHKKLANRYYKKADKQYQKWEAKKQKADDTAKNYNTPEAQAARKAKMKKAAIIGGAAVATGLAVYGGYKLNNYVRDTNYKYHYEKGRQLAEDYLHNNPRVRDADFRLRADYNTARIGQLGMKSIGTRQKEMTRAAQRIDKFNEGVARNAANKAIKETRKADTDSFVTAAKNVYRYNKRKRR